MIGNENTQRSNKEQKKIESFIDNLVKDQMIQREKFQELLKLNKQEVIKKINEKEYTTFEGDLYDLYYNTFECGISFDKVNNPIALITPNDQDSKKPFLHIVCGDNYNEGLKSKNNNLRFNPFNRQKIIKIVSPERIESFDDYSKKHAPENSRQEAVNNYAERIAQLAAPQERLLQETESVQTQSAADSVPNDFFMSNRGKVIGATMAISSAIGFLIAGPVGAFVLAGVGFVLGVCTVCIGSVIQKCLTSYSDSEKSTNSFTQNTPFLNNTTQNSNRSNGLPVPEGI